MKKPYVIIYSTITIDGKLASKTGYSKLSCEYDLKRLHALRARNDAVMVGINTILIDNPKLTVRHVKGKNPIRVIVDSLLKIPPTARVLDKEAKTIVITTPRANREKLGILSKKGIIVIEVPEKEGKVDLKNALEKLVEIGIRKLLVEGGGKLQWSLLKEKLVDEISITVSPRIFGNGINIFMGEGYKGPEAPHLKLKKVLLCECGQEVNLTYKLKKRPSYYSATKTSLIRLK